MKLKRKLLPIIGACSGVGATALALTGCSFFIGGGGSGDWIDAKVRYVPEGIEQEGYAEFSEEEATKAYLEQLNDSTNNGESTFVQDFYWFASNALNLASKVSKNAKADQAKFGKMVSLMKYDKIKLTNFAFDDTVFKNQTVIKMSFEYQYSYKYIETMQDEQGTFTETEEMSGKTIITNLPYTLSYNSSWQLWSVQPDSKLIIDDDYLKDKKNLWGLEVEATSKTTEVIESSTYGDITLVDTQSIEHEYYADELPFDDDDMEDAKQLLTQDSWCYSWYMYNVNYK
ncbi:MAG: hypothetical protein ACOQNY_02245 [Mycoplasmoidaceae bacterium]